MVARPHLRPLATFLAALAASGVPVVPVAHADDAVKVLVVPFLVVQSGVPDALGPKVTDIVADEIHSEDGLLLVTPPAPAPAAAAAEPSDGAKNALAQIEKGEGMVKRLKLKPGAQAIEAGLEDYESFASQVDVKKLREAYIQLGVAYSRLGDNDKAGEALENAVRTNPDAKLAGNYPPVFKTAFNDARKRVTSGPMGKVAVTGEGQVEIDAKPYGASPTSADLPAGMHFVRVTRGDGTIWGLKLTVNEGANTVAIPASGAAHAPSVAAVSIPELAPLQGNKIDRALLGALGHLAADQGADFVLFGGLYKTADGVGLAAHLYSARTKGATALHPAHFDADLVSAGIETNKVADEVAKVVKAFPRPGESMPAQVTSELNAPAAVAVVEKHEEPKHEKTPVVKASDDDQPKIVVVQQREPREEKKPDLTQVPAHEEKPAGELTSHEGEVTKHTGDDETPHTMLYVGIGIGAAILAGAAVTTIVVVNHNSTPVTGSASLNFQ
ncbi:MAG: hypothetical protein JST54_20415 [Deltaproteobacteria bacterium]|nr:hypothetical protein [Deltaproteobacteria bacterium]